MPFIFDDHNITIGYLLIKYKIGNIPAFYDIIQGNKGLRLKNIQKIFDITATES